MVRLTVREQARIEIIEQRVLHLTGLMKSAPRVERPYLSFQRQSLEWLLEVVGHAAATNCEGAFAGTQLRQGKTEDAQGYFTRKALREYSAYRSQQAQEAKEVGASATAHPEVSPAS